MANRFVTLLVVLGATSALAAADRPDPAAWALPKADADRWAGRVRGLVPPGWTVSAKGNVIVVQRDKAVRWVRWDINGPGETPGEPPRKRDVYEGDYRLRLEFGTKMSVEEHERLTAENAATAKERDRLKRGVADIFHKFDEFSASTPDEKRRLAAYREAVAKLPWHRLPDFYCADYSIRLTATGGWFSSVHDDAVRDECDGVVRAAFRYFAMYDPRAAAGDHYTPAMDPAEAPEPAGERRE